MLGWGVWTIGKRVAKRKAKSAAPTVDSGRPSKSLWLHDAGGGVVWRRHRDSDVDCTA